jgi:ferredoxin--NADP+ reductase
MTSAANGRPLRVAIVGSGPSGFYAADALLRAGRSVAVDFLERLPTPFGLVRGGVAPDHAKTKTVTKALDRIARMPGVRYFGNVRVGEDISVGELRERYDAVILACGADDSSRLGVPGEALPGVHGSAAFVGWYNGHPDHQNRTVDLSHRRALVVGHGNVAIDICRILVSPLERLAGTDIAAHALHVLARSALCEVVLLGRRGPAQSRFTNAELRELGSLPGCDVVVDAGQLDLDAASAAELAESRDEIRLRNLDILRDFAARPRRHERCIRIAFWTAPVEFVGGDRVTAARLRATGSQSSGAPFDLPCGLVVTSIGYRGRALPGVPFDDQRGIYPNFEGRLQVDGAVMPGVYVTGWIKRGPSGVIGTNRADSAATVAAILEDWPALEARPRSQDDGIEDLIAARRVRAISYEDWDRIDRAEIERGKPRGKVREKFTSVNECLQAAATP